ncbi:MAG: hypothetical protein KJO25_01525 [Bacteroidia bacterium]|nr:hypothetical protein [Bacteroidia bacterium]
MRSTFIVLILSLVFNSSWAQAEDNCACCEEQHRQFDFWLGKWKVTYPDGSFAGKNEIVKIQDSCVIQENWTSAQSGYTGTSYNFYNSSTDLWEQLWIDNQGQSLHMSGKRIANKMVLKTDDLTNEKGRSFFHRISWTKNEDGSVRQLWETVTGTEVTVAFDGLYKKEE